MLAHSTIRALRYRASGNAKNVSALLHTTALRNATHKFTMPAMSPTMTEGGIASWKKKEGDSFVAGDVLLEIETDKATIDVEAQEDGVLGKIIAKDGEKNIPVGKLIALLVEEGDDISNLEVPKEDAAGTAKPAESQESKESKPKEDTSSTSPPSSNAPEDKSHGAHIHVDGPVFPSVIRLLNEAGIKDYKKIKGTGIRGMLTKGDVLSFIGKASSPTGTYKTTGSSTVPPGAASEAAPAQQKKEVKPVDGPTLRSMIVSGLTEISNAKTAAPKKRVPTFNDVVEDYLPQSRTKTPTLPVLPNSITPKKTTSFLDGLI